MTLCRKNLIRLAEAAADRFLCGGAVEQRTVRTVRKGLVLLVFVRENRLNCGNIDKSSPKGSLGGYTRNVARSPGWITIDLSLIQTAVSSRENVGGAVTRTGTFTGRKQDSYPRKKIRLDLEQDTSSSATCFSESEERNWAD